MEPTSSQLMAPTLPGSAQTVASYGSCQSTMPEEAELFWESYGSTWYLCFEVATEAFPKVFLLFTLVASLKACDANFMACNQEDTPALRNYGEVLLCHYTKSFVFSFPAMATSVLLLLFGRDFLQKRFYYGILKAGGAVSFSENTAWKDPLFLAMCWDFGQCVIYTIFHMIVLSRSGQDLKMMGGGFVPDNGMTSAKPPDLGMSTAAATTLTTTVAITTTLTTTVAVKGALMLLRGPLKGGGAQKGLQNAPQKGIPAPPASVAKGAASSGGTALMLQEYIQTVMAIIATFLETLLLIVFVYFAYDITSTLVPMSEYLDSYEDRKGGPMVRLYPLKDSAAKQILEHCPQIISGAEGDLQTVYTRIVARYRQETILARQTPSPPEPPVEPLPDTEEPVDGEDLVADGLGSSRFGLEHIDLNHLATIGLFNSLWPAELLMRRDVRGRDPKTFRRCWVLYTLLSMGWLGQITFVLFMEAGNNVEHLLNKQFEQVIPLCIILFHAAVNITTMYHFCESLAPLGFTNELMGP
mmetsp:Transcript_73344/g.141878  ORF Transcript_73344/g.141878 Transcript_73344/m.141878 type:complete len:526 (+) Transcript_73344:73-1650(+)